MQKANTLDRKKSKMSKMNITVYTKNNCVQCGATKRALKKHGITFGEVNIDELTGDELTETRSFLMDTLGYASMPVVFIDENDHWSAFRPDKIKTLAETASTPV